MRHDRWNGKLILRRNYEVNLDQIRGLNRLGEYIEASSGKRRCVWAGTTNGSEQLKMWIDFDSEIRVRRRSVRIWK